MATSLSIIPSSYGLAKNPGQLVFKIQSDQYIVVAGVTANRGIIVDLQPADGETVIFDAPIFDAPVTFTFVSGIPANSLEVSIGLTVDDTALYLYSAIALHYGIGTRYNVIDSGFNTITFVGIAPGADYNISIAGTYAGFAFPAFTLGVTEVVLADLRIIADLWVKTGTYYEKVLELNLPPDQTGAAEIDVYEVLLGYLSVFKPGFGQSADSLAPGPLVPYRLRHTDYYTAAYHDYGDSGELRAVLAGYPEKLLGNQQFASQYFTDANDRLFLTRIPRTEGIKLPKDAPFYLYMYAKANADYKLGARLFYTDDTDGYVYNIQSRSTSENLVCWPAGYDLLGLDTLKTAGKTVKHYHLFVIVGASVGVATNSTEMFKVVVDEEYYQNRHYFFFFNSLGGVDTIFMSGNMELNIDTEGEKYQVSVPQHDEQNTYGEMKAGIKTFTNPNKYFTGYKSKAYINYLQELIKSELIYEVVADQHIEMLMISAEETIYTLNDDQYRLEVEMTPAQTNRGWGE